MEIYPAVDMLGGRAVRLTQGDYNRAERYYQDPLEAARTFAQAGAERLHLVDLDAARTGRRTNGQAIARITRESGLFVQAGGGVRDESAIQDLLEAGVQRIILGTAAIEDLDFTARMLRAYGPALAVGVDARDGLAAGRGWLETSTLDALELCLRLEGLGAQTLIYTDISRDGTLTGPNLEVYGRLKSKVSCRVIASGGVGSLGDVLALQAAGLDGVIIGRALYTGAVDLKEVLARC